ALPDCRDGLGQRLFAAVREKATLEEICAEAKTKRFTLSRVRRAVMCAVLHIREEDRLGRPPYARVLAMNRKGRELLSETGDTAEIPVLTQPKSVFHLGKDAEHIFELGSAAHDLTMLCYPGRASDRCGDDYRNGPVFVG
ncbi:MAG: nucleotidyltransferase family protein, partial [Oscillospiraceae bacterium]|nr:nucleotidyltransferase family protein [Oscillospiraceae bacterium]